MNFTLNGIQTHDTLSCTGQQTVKVLLSEKELTQAKYFNLNGIQTQEKQCLSLTGQQTV